MVDVFLVRGVFVNIKLENGEIFVYVVFRWELFIDVFKLMILDLDLNIIDNKGVLYLMLVVWFGVEKLVEVFVDIGVDCFFLDIKGNSVFYYVCMWMLVLKVYLNILKIILNEMEILC